jgi:hypothetical protein
MAIKDRNSQSSLYTQLRDTDFEELGEVAETLAKSYGIYLEFNRAQPRINDIKKNKKDWMYMIRIAIPGGGPITKEQWDILDDLSTEYTSSDSYKLKYFLDTISLNMLMSPLTYGNLTPLGQCNISSQIGFSENARKKLANNDNNYNTRLE